MENIKLKYLFYSVLSFFVIPMVIILFVVFFIFIIYGAEQKLEEKVSQLEDCVFNHKGCYEKEVK